MPVSEIGRGAKSARTLGRISLVICLVLFLLFTANLLLGKAKLAFGLDDVTVLSDVAEYLLLMATALFFAVAALMRESEVIKEENRQTGRK